MKDVQVSPPVKRHKKQQDSISVQEKRHMGAYDLVK